MLHLPTILVFSAASTYVAAWIIISLWLRDRTSRLLRVLSLAAVCGAAALILFGSRGLLPLWLSGGVATMLALLSFGFYWQALAIFHHRRISRGRAVAGAVIWMIFYFSVPDASLALRTGVSSAMIAIYCFLTAYEIFRARQEEPLPFRGNATLAHLLRGLAWSATAVLSVALGAPLQADGSAAGWFSVTVLLQVLFGIMSVVSMLILAKDRDAHKYRQISERDMLTGIRNRRSFVQIAEQMLLQRSEPVALLLLDIDHFKVINDTHGHAAGDTALVEFARLLEARIAPGWILARIGGEEFAILLPGVTTLAAAGIAETLRAAVAGLGIAWRDGYLTLTTSIGVAATDTVARDLDALLACADEGLYAAKAGGRNGVAAAALRHAQAAATERAAGLPTALPVLNRPRFGNA